MRCLIRMCVCRRGELQQEENLREKEEVRGRTLAGSRVTLSTPLPASRADGYMRL